MVTILSPTIPPPQIPDLDHLPFVQRDYLRFLIENHPEDYSLNISRGRGCYGKCVFCSVPSFYSSSYGPRIRQRSNENVLFEIEGLVHDYGVNQFNFVDDVFTSPAKQINSDTTELCEEIRKRNLKIRFSITDRIGSFDNKLLDSLVSAGLIRVFVGLEAATQTVLDRIDKKTRLSTIEDKMTLLLAKNVDMEISFVNFFPFNTLEDIKENISFFSQWGIDTLRSVGNRLEPYPGTAVYDELQEQGNLRRVDFSFDYLANTTDPRTDTLWEVIRTSVPYLALVSYQIRSIKSYFRKVEEVIDNSGHYYTRIIEVERKIVSELKDLLLDIICDLEKSKEVETKHLNLEFTATVVTKTKHWLSYLIEIRKCIRKEVENEPVKKNLQYSPKKHHQTFKGS